MRSCKSCSASAQNKSFTTEVYVLSVPTAAQPTTLAYTAADHPLWCIDLIAIESSRVNRFTRLTGIDQRRQNR
jgi:hypothetical protein